MNDLDYGATIKGFNPGQKVFARYTLKRILGRGEMGVVWLAQDEELGRETALKFLPEVVAMDPSAIGDLKREVRRAIELAHPHIVKIHDFVTDGRTAAVSMEYVTGQTLSAQRLDEPGQVFTPEKLAPWVAQLCSALDYAHHDAEVVHRDLKPTNLMIDGRGRLKVLDFGIAASISDSVSRVSNKGSSSGTPVYMSPQQMMGENPAITDDVYALGATLFELLAGKPPFHAGNIVLQVQNKVAPLLNDRRKTLGLAPIAGEWEQAIAACLAKDPLERPPSAGEVATRLADGSASRPPEPKAEVAAVRGETAVPPSPPQAKPGEAKGIRRVVLVAALVAISAAVVALLRNSGNPETKPGPIVDPQGQSAQETPAKPGLARLASITIPDLNLELLPIPAGTFRLGTPVGGEKDERPLTEVTFTQPFWLGKTEVTQRQWQKIFGWNRSAQPGDDLPATNFVWYAAMEYCRRLTESERAAGRLPAGYIYSLPTEMQWEYAARAGSTADRVPDLGEVAWYMANSDGKMHPVGQKRPNAWGLHDMLGNGMEMCLDDYAPYPGGKLTDPVTEIKGGEIVIRGGCYQNDTGRCRVASRLVLFSVVDPVYATFRLALIPESSRIDRRPPPPAPPQIGHAYTVPLYDIALVPIAPGTFTMGSTDDWFVKNAGLGEPTMRPLTEVTITRPFWLGKTEVTQLQWRQIMGTSVGEQKEKHKIYFQAEDQPVAGEGDDRPMYFVTWDEAMEFCGKLTALEKESGRLPVGYQYSLPTEAQWEYACRAGSLADKPADLQAGDWVEENSGNITHPVAQKPANAWGLHDMMGNVAELCLDHTNDLPGGKVKDLWMKSTEQGATHAERGGSYGGNSMYGHYGFRLSDGGGLPSSGVGFRVALVPIP